MKTNEHKYIPGDNWIICDRCGFQIRHSAALQTWDGLLVCEQDFESRHPLELTQQRRRVEGVKNSRPEPADVFLAPGDVKPEDL
jgi:hypothetical protein